jgi:hypothetical protein
VFRVLINKDYYYYYYYYTRQIKIAGRNHILPPLEIAWETKHTHVKISYLVASLPTSRQQVVFPLFVPSCQQVWNKLLTTCNNLVDIIRLVARLFQQVRYSHDITILLQPCVINLVTFLLYHDCIRLVTTTLLQVRCHFFGLINFA